MGNESVTAFSHGRFELFRPPRSEPRVRLDHVLKSDPTLSCSPANCLHRHAQFLRQQPMERD